MTTLIGSLWTMAMSGSKGCGGLDWKSAGIKNEVWTSFSNVFPSSIMWMVLTTGTVIPRYLPAHNQYGPPISAQLSLQVCLLQVGRVSPAEFSLQMKRISFMKPMEMLCSYRSSPLVTQAQYPAGYNRSSYMTSPICGGESHRPSPVCRY